MPPRRDPADPGPLPERTSIKLPRQMAVTLAGPSAALIRRVSASTRVTLADLQKEVGQSPELAAAVEAVMKRVHSHFKAKLDSIFTKEETE